MLCVGCRSHCGILQLASSVVDLMIQFFPESFDRLERDQGLFEGPKPVLLESDSFSDLAVLLSGSKREVSICHNHPTTNLKLAIYLFVRVCTCMSICSDLQKSLCQSVPDPIWYSVEHKHLDHHCAVGHLL